MEVLFWLVPAGVATVLAMAYATWMGRKARLDGEHEQRTSPRDDATARARIGAALAKPVSNRARYVSRQPVELGTGVVVRKTARTKPVDAPPR
ncbi:MAG: hypothetical protein M3474_06930 [Actinomycetota bacterium]|nr:hypothetical protein [Actinomycetota bacterium]